MRIRTLLLVLLLPFVLLACRGAPRLPQLLATSTPAASPTPSITPTPTLTPTPTPTPTPVPAVRISSGDEALFHGDWDQALQEYQLAQQGSSEAEIQSTARLGIGRTHLLAGDYEAAAGEFEALIETYSASPHLAQAYFFLAQAYSGSSRHQEAAQAYLNYLALNPGVIDAYVLDLRGDALFAAGDYANAARDYQAALQAPSMSDRTLLEMKTARALALGGQTELALGLYDSIYTNTTNDNTRALINLRKGQIFTNLGQLERAYEVYQDSVNNFPRAYESYSALLALVEAGVPVDELNRGLVDYFAGQYGVAIDAFARYLQNSPSDPGTALYYTGLSQRSLGNHTQAIQTWDQVISGYPDHRFWDDAWDQKAYTQWAFLNQYSGALQTLLDFVRTVPHHERAAEFLFDAGLVAERSGELDKAAEHWARVSSDYPNYEQALRARFLTGVTQFRLAKPAEALATFQVALTSSQSLGDRAAALLWIGKSQQALGQTEAARQAWEQAANADPTGYYSERARDILRERAPFTPPRQYDLAADPASERSRAEEWLRTTFALPEETDLSNPGALASDPFLLRGAALWELGLYNEARNEFEQLRYNLASDPVQSFHLAAYLNELGLYRSATMAARQVLTLAGMDDASSLNAPMYFNRLRFGTHFSDLVMPVAEEYGFHPLLLFSVIRQESLFESFARSSAAASGLMQVIPATGEEIAGSLNWPPDYTVRDLNRPLVSVNFGAYYLDRQRKLFDGDLYAALAAYNGGPGNAMEWKELSGNDPDVFLEVVRYSETRNYIRGIYEIFSIYRRLYDRTP